MINKLSFKLLVRPGSTGSVSRTARTSADFHIDGSSLLRILLDEDGGHGDFMGSLVRGYPNDDLIMQLKLQAAPSVESQRVPLYICPECGDVGCGAYSAKVSRKQGVYTWSDFAYENGYEEPCSLEAVGPFAFEADQYEAAIESAL